MYLVWLQSTKQFSIPMLAQSNNLRSCDNNVLLFWRPLLASENFCFPLMALFKNLTVEEGYSTTTWIRRGGSTWSHVTKGNFCKMWAWKHTSHQFILGAQISRGPNFLGPKFLGWPTFSGTKRVRGPNEIGDHFSYSREKAFQMWLLWQRFHRET